MTEKLDTTNYVYCEKHDIFFNKNLQEAAAKENQDLKKEGLLERVNACPMCKQEFTLALIKIHSPKNYDEVLRQRTLFQETEDLSKV